MRLFLFFIIFSFTNKLFSQLSEKNKSVLQKTEKAIAALHNYSYNLVREYKYPSDNYNVTIKGKVSFFKNENEQLLGFNFQAICNEYIDFYKDLQGFTLLQKDNTIDIRKKIDSSDISANRFVSYSIIAIQKLIPQLLNLPINSVNISDSVIAGKKYFKVKVITKQSYFDFYNLELTDEKDFRKEIFLLINASTYLPYQYFVQSKVTNYGIDFLRNTYTNIKNNIPILSVEKWEPGNYMPPYKIKVDDEEQKVIAVGDSFPITNLQKYSPNGSSTISTSSFSTSKTIFYFWIKSCGPCIASFPKLKAFQDEYKNKGVDLVMVNCYDKENDIAFFYNKHQPNYLMLYNGISLQSKVGIDGYPTVIVVDNTLKVLYKGIWDEKSIIKIL
jgi:thiol-disulfide isomerase/thioredoxin